MAKIYNITDSSDGKVLITLSSDWELSAQLSSIKAKTDKIWYANSNNDLSTLSDSNIAILDNTVNGDWNEIFEALLEVENVDCEIVEVEEV